MRPNAAIFFQSFAFETSGRKLMGAQSASDGFLRAFVQHSGVDRFYCLAEGAAEFREFEQRVTEFSPTPGANAEWIRSDDPQRLRAPGCLYHPQPAVADRAWQRRAYDETAYSICGVTHTTCTAAAMDSFGSHIIAPLWPWDAVICTSTAVKSTIDRVHAHWCDYLGERLGGRPGVPFELPVIPLGVNCDDYARRAEERAGRERQRAELGIGEDEIAFLFLGRLSFHAKAHPLPMYRALEEAARVTGKKLHLIQAGWFANRSIQDEFVKGARDHCPSVNSVFLDGRRPEVRERIWFAADIFTSLSDNIQETFGLVPIEAMAAGLPQVISDWDGYRDTVRHGIDGFRIPTAMPPPGTSQDIARRYAFGVDSYDRYIGHSSQCTSVDTSKCAEAYISLIENPELRRSMGDSGARRARECFDWPVIIKAYQQLWQELKNRREQAISVHQGSANHLKDGLFRTRHTSASDSHGWQGARTNRLSAGQPRHPLREEPFALFADYATTTLDSETVLALDPRAGAQALEQMYNSPLANYVGSPFLLASKDECQAVLSVLRRGPCAIAELLELIDPDDRRVLHRSLSWLSKTGIVQIEPPAEVESVGQAPA